MPDDPKLTIAIPHRDRSEHLHRAIDSCLRQTVPVRVLVADQGHTDGTARVMRRYEDHPHVAHEHTDATCLWENWKVGALACETDLVSWLQDDDILARGYAARVLGAFDRWPEALTWMARLVCGPDDRTAAWWGTSGPWVPMRLLDGEPDLWQGEILVPTMYLTSWSLSPAVAFRCGVEFTAALEAMPSDCDLFAERLILAEMGRRGMFVADPVLAGHWIHHGRNESFHQHKDQARQSAVLARHLDVLMDSVDWPSYFGQWCLMMGPAQLLGWLESPELKASRHREALVGIMRESLAGRVELGREDGVSTVLGTGDRAPHPAPAGVG